MQNGSDAALPQLDVTATLAGKRILFIGATGFVGKVALSMLLRKYPGLGKVFVLVRPGAGSSSDDRFFRKIASSPVFDPIREVWGAGFDAFLREKVVPLAGDVSRPLCNFSAADVERLGQLDAIINCAGLVSFNPSLESAIRINVMGPRHTLDLARKTGAAVVHVSTCFVAGERPLADSEVWEDEPVVGYFPRRHTLRAEDFSLAAEVADCQRVIEQVKAMADDRAHVSQFRDQGAARLRDEGRDADDERTLRIAVQRERKMWVAERLTDLGMERAQHWGWPNTYTYSKSLGDQVCAEAKDVRTCIVRPAIVESAIHYPMPGWNEGFTTTAPLAFLSIRGHRNYPSGDGVMLDIVPVDFVAAGLIMATAATIAGQNELVYQLGSSDTNPLYMRRAVELLGLHKRRYYQDRRARGEGSTLLNIAQARLEPIAVSRDRFNRTSAPLWKRAAEGLSSLIDRTTPKWGAPRWAGMAEHAKQRLADASALAKQTDDLFQLFMPFIYEQKYVFRCDHTRALHARLAPVDQQLLPWAPQAIEWRHYWLEVHMKGLEHWIFPDLEEEFAAKPKSVYTYKDLLELFEATTKHHKSRTAMRLLPTPTQLDDDDDASPPRALPADDEPIRYTYADLANMATHVAHELRGYGVAPGDRVLLLSENRPEWGISYFGILKAGAQAVPVDWQSSADDVLRLVRAGGVKLGLWSAKVAARLETLDDAHVRMVSFERLFARDTTPPLTTTPTTALVHTTRADDVASLIFTSGTTGRPKGVMLSHRNFSSLLSKLASVFDIDKHDALLSVLPLHHTFEFTAGLLMPLMRGAQISYMEEIDADALTRAFERVNVTGMVGVPALWQLFERKITEQIRERGPLTLRLFRLLAEGNRRLRAQAPPWLDRLPLLNWGRLLFWPVHQKFGGRLRLMISGGAALPVETNKFLHGLGFNLFEGYGLTEAAPVLAVSRPGKRVLAGSVGEALPGIELKIEAPDASGVGEIVASGPNVMLGYFEDPESTAQTIQNGKLHTGDLGRIDDENRLWVVGRKKEMILGPSGENVYPDELEDLYRDHPLVAELSIVGLAEGTTEIIACLVRCEDDTVDAKEKGFRAVRAEVAEHFRKVSTKLPLWKRVKILHFAVEELPKTATRKVKRKAVVDELRKLELLKQKGAGFAKGDKAADAGDRSFVAQILVTVTGRAAAEVTPTARMEALGFDSLMFTELQVALEAAGVVVPDTVDLTNVVTVSDLEKLVGSWPKKSAKRSVKASEPVVDSETIHVPAPVVTAGRAALEWGQRATYERLFRTTVTGAAYIPQNRGFLVAANHASHLDMGLAKHALGSWGNRVVALAAKDYFFEDPIKRAYFENFTNLVPMDRHGSLRESLRLASDVLAQGYVLLIFPEGTRSPSGVMLDFKPSIGYLALTNKVDVLPMYLDGTHDALPKGSFLPKHRDIAAHIGPLLTYEQLRAATASLSRAEAYRRASELVEAAVRARAPEGSVNRLSVSEPRDERLTAASVVTDAADGLLVARALGAQTDEEGRS